MPVFLLNITDNPIELSPHVEHSAVATHRLS